MIENEKSQTSNFVEISDLAYQYSDGTKALEGVDLSIRQGEKLVVIGPNGSGKSTLFLCLNGVLKAKEGSIRFQGKPMQYDKRSLIDTRKNIGIVFQDPETQLFCINVYQEVAFGPANLGLKHAALQQCVEHSMDMMGITHLKDKPPHFLSGGQKKQVSIASVVAMNPQLIIFDEPTSALDPVNVKRTMELMDELNQKGITIIMSTHDVEIAYEWADRIAVLKNGRIQKVDRPYEVFSDTALMREANICPPKILQFFAQLKEYNVLSQTLEPPKNMKELETYLAAAK